MGTTCGGGFFTYHRLPLLRGNVACDKGVKIPLGYAVSPFKKGEQNPQSFGQPLSVKGSIIIYYNIYP